MATSPSNSVYLRPATRQDTPAVWSVFSEVVADGTTYAQDGSTTAPDFEAYWFDRGGEQWIAEQDGTLAGAYTLRSNHPGRGAHVATASYLVSRARRGAGVGRALGSHSLERARALGFAAMQFNFVVSTNAPAVRLWTSLGFEVVGTLPRAFEHPTLGKVDALVMFRGL